LNETRITEKLLTANGVKYAGLSEQELDGIALDYVPRVLDGPRGKGKVAVINADYLQQLIDAKEEYDWLLQQPINRRCLEEVKRTQARRDVVDGELKEYSRRMMNDTCPACRRNLIAKYGTAEEQDADLWRRVKSIGDWDKPRSMFDRVSRRSGVGVAALGRGKGPQGVDE